MSFENYPMQVEHRSEQQMQDDILARDEMLALLAHDLRSPLQTITLATQLTVTGDERERAHAVQMIQRAVAKANRLIDDLLAVSRAETRGLELAIAPASCSELLREARELVRAQIETTAVRIDLELAEADPVLVIDRQQVLQVLRHLLDNALHHSQRGSRVVLRYQPESDRWMRVSVIDTGEGMSNSVLSHIFDRFWQARTNRRASAGLGLALAKAVVEGHGGRIWVESTPGAGAAVHLLLPWARADLDRQTAPGASG